jgi:MerR family transcriptional regulator, light-induced transcriptional regulator
MPRRLQSPRPSGEPPADRLLSIGELAAATGVAVPTLRAWEQRYGRPAPARLRSGHRRYGPEQVCLVRRIVDGLARGHRLAALMAADADALQRLLGEGRPTSGLPPLHLLELARQWRGPEIHAALRDSYVRLGPLAFVEQRLAPLFRSVGCAWAGGEACVRHEHFLSAAVDDLLRALRLELRVPDGAPAIVLATLEGEQHGLGLQMAALVVAAHGLRPLLLGACAPLPDIVAAARESGAAGVAIGVSAATAGPATDRVLAELRRRLPPHTPLLVGGREALGPRRGPRGVRYLGAEGFSAFSSWLDDLR